MSPIRSNQQKTIIKKIIDSAAMKLHPDFLEQFSTFLNSFYDNVAVDDLEERSLADLYGIALSNWNLLLKRQTGECKIRVFNPRFEQDGWESTHTIVQVVHEDMPFLVDSMRIEINRLGLTIHLIIHTGEMRIKRDNHGEVIEIASFTSNNKDALREACIYMEVDRQTDPAVLETIVTSIERVLQDVRLTNEDWHQMEKRVDDAIVEFEKNKLPQSQTDVQESIDFLRWLKQHFIFIGSRSYKMTGEGDERAMQLIPGSGLGVLRDEKSGKSARSFSDLPPEARKLALSLEIIIISQTNTESTIHRHVYTYCISVRKFIEKKIIGEERIIGLLTSEAYNSNLGSIPLIRCKVQKIHEQAKLPPAGHAEKALLNILETLPRDDVFQGNAEDLCELAIGILQLQERRRIRLFVLKDVYRRYFSCLVYVPRDNFNTDLLYRIQEILQEAFHGYRVTFNIYFPGSILSRIHYVIRVNPEEAFKYDIKEIEKKLVEVGKSWKDALREHLLDYFGEEKGNQLFNRYGRAFPAGYREVFTSRSAIYDIEHIEKLTDEHCLEMSFYRSLALQDSQIRFKLYHLHHTVPLSDALPMLENMGLRVIGEQPYEIILKDGTKIWINDFSMVYDKDLLLDVEDFKELFHAAFNKIWHGEAENDGFNRLVLGAHLSWREITVLRAYAKYFRQIGFTFSQQYIEESLVTNPDVVKLLIELFKLRFDPEKHSRTQIEFETLNQEIQKTLDNVANLDQDRILRRYLDVIQATIRTNYYQTDSEGNPKAYLSFKFDPHKVSDLPFPLPMYEIFVYSPYFEGVHLRADKVARGGIRWSDRREDFRTEILGLMKAQQVKNAVIVPSGAKGGFVLKRTLIDASREVILEEAVECYKNFIRGMLDITDNMAGGRIIHPKDVILYDGEDSYLVVAADKGTATFSDIANKVSAEYNYWLDDAFASGGSAGYDHKKMGITARGAWVSVERHFQDLSLDPQRDDFTAIGIGDMSGDVFGNGMLMSEHIRLIGAFNHMHIFLDPNPDAKTSYQERLRLFQLPRSTWEDYDKNLISSGGGVFRRSVKAIRLPPEIRELFDIDKEIIVPNDLIRILLKARVDLIWNGGIGTYVKAARETHTDVGDRTNDGVRVNANELCARVIAEGGNLGLTQLARIEYALNGGKINTDFIDNCAGVNCSDHEVNIKILLNTIVAEGELTEKQRNKLLADMTNEVSHLVLSDNYRQTRAISLALIQSLDYLDLYQRFIEAYTESKKLDPELEFLPDRNTLMERKANGIALTRPEISILLAYSKIILKEEILNSSLPEDDFLKTYIESSFPQPLRHRYNKYMEKHQLRREIIATKLSNDVVNDMGIVFVYQMYDETGADTPTIVRAYIAARSIINMREFFQDIELLSNTITIEDRRAMMIDVTKLVRRAVRWLLRNVPIDFNISATVDHYSRNVENLRKLLPQLLIGIEKDYYDSRVQELKEAKVPKEIAMHMASMRAFYATFNVIHAATEFNANIEDVAIVYFTLLDRLELTWFREQINAFPIDNRWAVLARSSFKGDLDWLQRALTLSVLKFDGCHKSIYKKIETWFIDREVLIERWRQTIADFRSTNLREFAMLTVAMRELYELARTSERRILQEHV